MELSRRKFSVAFCGTPSFVLPVAEYLLSAQEINLVAVITQPDKPGNKKKVVAPAVAEWGKAKQLIVLQPASLKESETQQRMKELNLDAVIVFAYGKLIPESALSIPSKGWVNIHPSLLPLYRGATPIQSALLDGIHTTGTSLILLDKGMDSGPLIGQTEYGILPTDTADSLRTHLTQKAIDLLSEKLTPYLSGTLVPQQQDDLKATFTKQLTKEDGHIDWEKNAAHIVQMIKACEPWPHAWTISEIGTLAILKASLGISTQKPAGTLFAHAQELHIACGDHTTLRVERIRREGKNETDGASFLRGALQKIISPLH